MRSPFVEIIDNEFNSATQFTSEIFEVDEFSPFDETEREDVKTEYEEFLAESTNDKGEELYHKLQLSAAGLSLQIFKHALTGYNKLIEEGRLPVKVLTIVDFTQSSANKRMYIIDMQREVLLLQTNVAHGKNSGTHQMATKFSNVLGSNQSSLGFYITKNSYHGKSNRLSLRLDGIEIGINDNAYRRAIVIHGADYVKEGEISGRSWGCPAVPQKWIEFVVQTLKNGSCLYLFANDSYYLQNSKLLDPNFSHKSSTASINPINSISWNEAISKNNILRISLGWDKFTEKINDFLLPYSGQSNVSLDEASFAEALAKWQQEIGLEDDGILGPKTWEKLSVEIYKRNPNSNNINQPISITSFGMLGVNKNTISTKDAYSTYQFTKNDALWLARFVEGEAGGKDTPDNHAVIWAMFNRFGLRRHRVPSWTSFEIFIRQYSTTLQPYLKSVGAAERVWYNNSKDPNKYPVVFLQDTYPNTNIHKVQLKKHITLQNKKWEEFNSIIQNLVINALNGKVPNPGIGNASDFANTYIYLMTNRRKHNLTGEPSYNEWVEYTIKNAVENNRIWIGYKPNLDQKNKNAFFLMNIYKNSPLGLVTIIGSPTIHNENIIFENHEARNFNEQTIALYNRFNGDSLMEIADDPENEPIDNETLEKYEERISKNLLSFQKNEHFENEHFTNYQKEDEHFFFENYIDDEFEYNEINILNSNEDFEEIFEPIPVNEIEYFESVYGEKEEMGFMVNNEIKDLGKIIIENRRYAQALGWGELKDKINEIILPYSNFSKVSLGEEEFAKALEQWQKANGFSSSDSDGILGPNTWVKMKTFLGLQSNPISQSLSIGPIGKNIFIDNKFYAQGILDTINAGYISINTIFNAKKQLENIVNGYPVLKINPQTSTIQILPIIYHICQSAMKNNFKEIVIGSFIRNPKDDGSCTGHCIGKCIDLNFKGGSFNNSQATQMVNVILQYISNIPPYYKKGLGFGLPFQGSFFTNTKLKKFKSTDPNNLSDNNLKAMIPKLGIVFPDNDNHLHVQVRWM